jgi:hypothetical protein
MRGAVASGLAVGSAVVNDTGTAVYLAVPELVSTTQVQFIGTAGGLLGAAPSFALANTDIIRMSLKYPIA